MDNPVAVSVIIDPINQTHLGQTRGSVSVAGLTVNMSGLGWVLVWVAVLVVSFAWHAVHVYVSKSPPCVAGTTLIFALLLTPDFCWAY